MFHFVTKEISVEIHIIKLLTSYLQFSKCTIDNKDNKLFQRLFFMLNSVFFRISLKVLIFLYHVLRTPYNVAIVQILRGHTTF